MLPLRQSTTYSPHSAAPLLGISESTIRNQLRAAPLDGRRRVTEGPWAGAYRRGTHWRIPADVVRRMAGSNGPASDALAQLVADQDRRIERLEGALRALYQALGDVVRDLSP